MNDYRHIAVRGFIRKEDITKYGEDFMMDKIKTEHTHQLVALMIKEGLGTHEVEYDVANQVWNIYSHFWVEVP